MSKAKDPVQGVMILAAGQGKRMQSQLPKVLHEIGGEPMLFHILHRVRETAPDAPVAIVVGHGRETVESAVRAHAEFSKMKISFVHQTEQRGTGHAARCAMDSPWGEERIQEKSNVLILPGDLPLIPAQLMAQLLAPLGKAEVLRLLTCELPDPTGYGRIVRRGAKGPVLRIVEEKDANLRQKSIKEVAVSIYLFQAAFLRFGLHRLSNKNAQGEYYLTDLIAQAATAKKKTEVLIWENSLDLRGINDPWELAAARRILNETTLKRWSLKGVKVLDPITTWVDPSVELAPDVTLHPGVILSGRTRISQGAIIGPHVVLKDVEVGESSQIKTGTTGESAKVGPRVQVGPYAHLRPESVIGADSKIGNFVELKKTKIGEHTSVAHLSYLGDAVVGNNVNIGCGFVTCNFDGRVIQGQRKHKTVIEDDVFMGSDCQTVAPVRIGKGSFVASGSTVTEDVPADSLAIARARQVTKPGYARKLRDKGRSG
jgi:bifunctional UDP-N-acetylglucosamine pyrophosphorylase/glucosamine-1-phosphate N-acetyltransferase